MFLTILINCQFICISARTLQRSKRSKNDNTMSMSSGILGISIVLDVIPDTGVEWEKVPYRES